jgi:phosphohistidine phosphatase
MDLLIIRHGIAGDQAEFARTGRPDEERPLTEAGKRKMRRGARGLRALVPTIGTLASSPLVRARETAEIIAQEYGGIAVHTVSALEPDQPPYAVAAWLRRHSAQPTAIVGHDPGLSDLVGWLLTGTPRSLIKFKKGGACLVALPDSEPSPGTGILQWALTSSHLRALAE